MKHGVLVLAVTLMIAAGPQQSQGPRGTVLVANMDDDSVWLIDLPSGTLRATLPTRMAPHEVATSNDGTMAAVTNYGDEQGPGNLIQLIDVEPGSLTGELVVEGYERIHGVRFLPGDSLLALTSEWTGEILIVGVLDGEIRRVLSTLGRASHMLALGGSWIYAANIVDGTVSRVDPAGDDATFKFAKGG